MDTLQRTNSQRKRDEAEAFNKKYLYKKTPEYKAKMLARRKRGEAKALQMMLAMRSVGGV